MILTALAVSCSVLLAQGGIILPELLQGDIVLQQKTDARIWGKAAPGSELVVNTPWNGANYRAKAAADSLWSVKVATPAASHTPYDITVSCGGESLVMRNVLIGDVWFCGGQSNMAMPLKGMTNCAVDNSAETIMRSGRNKGLRYVTVAQHQATESDPGYFTKGRWYSSGPATAGDVTATGYFFGQALYEALDIPIGLLSCNWSGSFVEDWMDKELAEKFPDQKLYGANKAPTKMYYGMFEPASLYTVKGMIWYQGESNVGSPDYAERLAAAVELWKDRFEVDRLPFYIVEIAPFDYTRGGFELLAADLRDQQMKASRIIPDSGLACTNDLVYDYELHNIHPAQKQAVGERLAMLALSKAYGFGNPCEGPVFREMVIDGNTAAILFDNARNGFVNREVKGFEIAGEDRVFHPAKATIGFAPRRPGQQGRGFGMGGYAVRVSCDEVPEPVAVRYGYGAFVPGDLKNTEGLPAYPFRTDDWPLQ